MSSYPSAIWAGPLAVLLLWLACALPGLNTTRLQDVDELTHARVAQAAALKGQWWPLVLDGRAFYEKPPLLLWLAGATAKFSRRPYDAWPYRLWTCLGAGAALFCLALIGGLLGRPGLGFLAAAALVLQGDFIFHSRFFTFDTPFLACALASLCLALRATLRGPSSDWWSAGIALALAAAFKSWFVLALAPAYACALVFALPRDERRGAALALSLPPLAALLAWVALYVQWNGWGFLAEEWSINLAGRALGHVNAVDPEGQGAFYLKWAARTSPALLPWVLALPLGMAPAVLGAPRPPREGRARAWAFARAWTWGLCLSWLLGLSLVRAQTINYPLPLEAGLCLGLALEWGCERGRAGNLIVGGLWAASLFSALCLGDPFWMLALGAGLGLAWMLTQGRGEGRFHAGTAARVATRACGVVLACLLAREAFGLLTRPLDPNRQVADLLLAHPARSEGERLWIIGGSTQAPDFYSSYGIQRLSALPARRPAQATLVATHRGWMFYPAWTPPLKSLPKGPA